MLTHTRKYGGASPTRIASIMRCMFPYKRFAEAEVESILAAATSTSRYVPTDENMYRARFWLHLWYRHILHLSGVLPDLYSARSLISPPASFQILNSVCDTLIFLVLAFGRYYYSTIPFFIMALRNRIVEHFLASPCSFSHAEFLKMVQHIMVRRRILEFGLLNVSENATSTRCFLLPA